MVSLPSQPAHSKAPVSLVLLVLLSGLATVIELPRDAVQRIQIAGTTAWSITVLAPLLVAGVYATVTWLYVRRVRPAIKTSVSRTQEIVVLTAALAVAVREIAAWHDLDVTAFNWAPPLIGIALGLLALRAATHATRAQVARDAN